MSAATPEPPPSQIPPRDPVRWPAVVGWTLGLATGPAVKQALYFTSLTEPRSAAGIATHFLFLAAVLGLLTSPVGVWIAGWAVRVRDRRGETWPTRPVAFLAAYLPALLLGSSPAVEIRIY